MGGTLKALGVDGARLVASWREPPGPGPAGLPEGASMVGCGEDCSSTAYFDTPGLRLLQRGMTLRYRRDAPVGEDRWILDLPADLDIDLGAGVERAAGRRQPTWPGGPLAVPAGLATELRPLLSGENLERVAELTTLRRRTELRDRSGARLAEIDDDWVSASVPTSVRLRTVTVEFDDGGSVLLDAGAAPLTAATPAVLHGWLAPTGAQRVAGGPDLARVLGAGPVPTRTPAPGRESSVAEVVEASLTAGLDRLVAGDLGIRFGTGPEPVHQARVATRRLRCDLRTLRAVLDPGWVRHTRSELGWIADLLGEVRDADVLAEGLACALGADAPGAESLQAALGAQREDAYGTLLKALRSDRYATLVASLDDASGAPPFARETPGAAAGMTGRAARPEAVLPAAPARSALPVLLRRPWRRLQRSVEHLGPVPTDGELHRVRIAAKQVRYAAELSAPVVGRRAARLARAARRLQEVLGEHHDAVVAERWLRHQVAATDDTASGLAARQCITLERERQAALRDEWPEAWRDLRRKDLHHWIRRT